MLHGFPLPFKLQGVCFIWMSLLIVVIAGEGKVVTVISEVLSGPESLILLWAVPSFL